MAEHGGGKDGGCFAVGEEEFGDGAVADVGGGAEGGFPIAEAAIDGGSDEARMAGGQGAHFGEVPVGDGDHFEAAGGVCGAEGR